MLPLDSLLPMICAMAGQDDATGRGGPAVNALEGLLNRTVGPDGSAHFMLHVRPDHSAPQGLDTVILADLPDGRVFVNGSSPQAVGYGIGMYFRSICNASLTWVKTGGLESARLCFRGPGRAPAVGEPRQFTRSVKWTYYQNVVDSSYS